MARFVTAIALLAAASGASAFAPGLPAFPVLPRLRATDFFIETDFDAPVPADPQSGTAVLENEPIVDDECYMGKDGAANNCVDFDPPKVRTRSANAMDRDRPSPSWTLPDEIDFDAPVLADPQSGTAVLESEPIVDDECYMGKDGQADNCVDFDPPKVAMDGDQSTPSWTLPDEIDFDAPVLADPQSGTAVLESEPIVDDECYMGKDGQVDDCVDFDPPKVARTRSANAMDRDRSAPAWTQAS